MTPNCNNNYFTDPKLPGNDKISATGRQEMTTEARHNHWRTIIDNQAASGLNIAEYCRENHIRDSCFYTWRRKLREQQSFTGGFVELKAGRLSKAASGIRIQVDAKLAIEVDRGFDPFTLRAVLETLGTVRCSV